MSSTTATETVVLDAKSRKQLQPEVSKYPDVNTIRKAIPPHCFVPSTWLSLAYLLRDSLMSAALVYGALKFIPQIPNPWIRAVAWMIYGFCQGLVGTGLWILAHECGHGAFSVHRHLNDFIGWAVHSVLLVPYFSWKFSHARHHMYTGHMDKDMTWVPHTARDYERDRLSGFKLIDPDLLEDAPLFNLLKLVGQQLFGWQIYLFLNGSAGRGSLQRPEDKKWYRASHFDPFSVAFKPQEAAYILISDIGLGLVGYGLYCASQVLDAGTVFLLYGVPYFWVHHWLISITYLHHNHPDVKHYDAEGWTYVKGALATIDRDFGFIGKHLFHGIIETHVIHHLFSRIPFYYQDEATEAVKPLLGDLYQRDERSFFGQLWSVFNECKYVEADPKNPGEMKWNTARVK